MSDDTRRTENKPHDRLTRLCAAMTDTLDAHPEKRPNDKCMVFLDDGKRGGIVMHGYDDDVAAMTDLLLHLRAMFRANDKVMDIGFLGPDGFDFLPGGSR